MPVAIRGDRPPSQSGGGMESRSKKAFWRMSIESSPQRKKINKMKGLFISNDEAAAATDDDDDD